MDNDFNVHQLITDITSKPNWSEKILDQKIVSKWKSELSKQHIKPMFLDLIIELLKKYPDAKDKTNYDDEPYRWLMDLNIDPKEFGIASICKCKCRICQGAEIGMSEEDDDETDSDTPKYDDVCTCTSKKLAKQKLKYIHDNIKYIDHLIDTGTKKFFKTNVEILKTNIPKIYHPGSNNQMLDIIHPSLYCYTKGITKVREGTNVDNEILFQWLPAEFKVDDENNVYIQSHINNLDQIKYVDLYIAVANIFGKFLPHFRDVLDKLYHTGKITEKRDLSKCQVIVKIAETVLTPYNPGTPPSSWHLEGLPYEKIIATGIYYYEMTNITENNLEFRGTPTDFVDIDYPQDGHKYVKKHYEFSGDIHNTFDNTGSIVNLGNVDTHEDLCIVFPNFMQHRVSNFGLRDESKPGYRKILVFFLVDPATPILSTANVPPQQSYVSLEDAKVFMEMLMFQRKYEMKEQKSFYERGWSLCEH